MSCLFRACAQGAPLDCMMCGGLAHAACTSERLTSTRYATREGVVFYSPRCCDEFLVEEFIHDIDWDFKPTAHHRVYMQRSTRLPQRVQRHYFVRDRQALLKLDLSNPIQSIRAFAAAQHAQLQSRNHSQGLGKGAAEDYHVLV